MDIGTILYLSYLLAICGFFAVCYLILRLIKAFKKYDVKYAHLAYLIIGIVPVYELIKTIHLKYKWFEKDWYYSPFVYFWLLLLLFCIVQFIRETIKLRNK